MRGRLFVIWMVGLGGLYLLLVVSLLGANLLYLDYDRLADDVRYWWEHRDQDGPASAPVGDGDIQRPRLDVGAIIDATVLSFQTSGATVVLALVIGVPAGYVLSRYQFPGKIVVDTVLDIPIVLPPLVVGVSLLIFFQTTAGRFINDELIELVFTPRGIVLAQFVVAAAFGIRTIKATFDQIDPRLESVARTLGATRGQAFFRVTMPMAGQGILAAAVMTWARAIGEFGPILIFCGTTRRYTEVLPTSIFLEFSVGNLQAALAVSMFMVLLAGLTLLIFKKLGGRFTL